MLPVFVTTKPGTPPLKRLQPPSHLIARALASHNVVELVWTSTKASLDQSIKYTVEYRKVGHRTWKIAKLLTSENRYKVTNLQPLTKYEFSVRAKAGKEQSRRTTTRFITKAKRKEVTPLLPTTFRPAFKAKVLVKAEPVKWDKLNITWKVQLMCI